MYKAIRLKELLRRAREVVRDAQISPRGFFALYLIIDGGMRLADFFANRSGTLLPWSNLPGLFVSFLVFLMSMVLSAGCKLYCLGVCRNERMEYLTLFDGFSFAGRIILLHLLEYLLILLWLTPSMVAASVLVGMMAQDALWILPALLPLMALPAVVAWYRYRFALYNLCDNPSMSPVQALRLSALQTLGQKRGLFRLDFSFCGWIALANLPTIAAYAMNYMTLMGVSMPTVNNTLSIAAQLLFPIAVGIFYLPRYYAADTLWFLTVREARQQVDEGGLPPLR